MITGDEELLAEMRANLDAVQAASERARERARDMRTTEQDKENILSVTASAHGELHQITFHGDSYRDLAPAELADLIVKTARRACKGARQAALEESASIAGDLFDLHTTAQRATSIDELIEGIVGLVNAAGTQAERRR